MQELPRRIMEVRVPITTTLIKVRVEFESRPYDCQEVGGSYFEHIAKGLF